MSSLSRRFTEFLTFGMHHVRCVNSKLLRDAAAVAAGGDDDDNDFPGFVNSLLSFLQKKYKNVRPN